MTDETLFSRIKAARVDAGFGTVKAAVSAFGWTYSTYAEYENGRSMPSRSALMRIAKAYRVSVDWLLSGKGQRKSGAAQPTDLVPGMTMLEIVGDVAAGVWREEIAGAVDHEAYPVPVDPRFPLESQYLLRVRGASINKRAEDGSLVRCLDINAAPRSPRTGDWVIVRQMKNGTSETTVKLFNERRDGKVELLPYSNDPRFQEPLQLSTKDADEIAVIAFVIDFISPATRF